MNKQIKLGLLALAGAALLTPAVHAATVSATQEDLILGFRATGGTGSGVNLEVNLGSIANFYNAAPGTTFTLPALAYQDLVETYGANWATRSDLFWGAAAHYSNLDDDPNLKPATTLWVTDVALPAPLRGSDGAQANPGSKIQALYSSGTGSLNGKTSTANSSSAAVIDKTLAGSWGAQIGTGNSFAYFNPKIDIDVNSQKSLDLYELQPDIDTPGTLPGTKLGTLVLGQNGLSFNVVPEPSTGLLVALSIAFGTLLRRRK